MLRQLLTVDVYSTITNRIHHLGLASMVLRDTCDVLLELNKVVMCFQIQNGKPVKSLSVLVKALFLVFTCAFVLNQLYYYPLYCMYHAINIARVHNIRLQLYFWLVSCGLVFLVLDLIWFMVG